MLGREAGGLADCTAIAGAAVSEGVQGCSLGDDSPKAELAAGVIRRRVRYARIGGGGGGGGVALGCRSEPLLLVLLLMAEPVPERRRERLTPW